MEIKDFIILWTYSQWRQAIVVIPPLSPERETCCILSVNQLLHACLLTKWKKCNILSLFLQIHIVESTIPRRSSVPLSLQKGAAYGMLPICKAFVFLPFYKRLFHIPLQSPWGCITLWVLAHTDLRMTTPFSLTCESSDSHRQQTKFAAFILSLQNGKRVAFFPLISFSHSYLLTKGKKCNILSLFHQKYYARKQKTIFQLMENRFLFL